MFAIYARENGQGMAFPPPTAAVTSPAPEAGDTGPTLRLAKTDTDAPTEADLGDGTPVTGESSEDGEAPPEPPGPAPTRPTLKRVK